MVSLREKTPSSTRVSTRWAPPRSTFTATASRRTRRGTVCATTCSRSSSTSPRSAIRLRRCCAARAGIRAGLERSGPEFDLYRAYEKLQRLVALTVRWRHVGISPVMAVSPFVDPGGAHCDQHAMAKAKRRVGRPRSRRQTLLARWLDSAGLSRESLANRLGIARQSVDRLCRGERRPGLDLALHIEAISAGAVPASSWKKVPPRGRGVD